MVHLVRLMTPEEPIDSLLESMNKTSIKMLKPCSFYESYKTLLE